MPLQQTTHLSCSFDCPIVRKHRVSVFQLLSSDELLIQNLNEEEKDDLLSDRVVPVHLVTSFHEMSEALIGSVDLLDGVFALLVGS